jgi:23S rRNA (pseudouridine1915-N3)-methyltransferase
MTIINIIAVGKMKAEYLPLLKMYSDRLRPFCKLKITELPEAFVPENPSTADIEKALGQESKGFLPAIKSGNFCTALCVEGKQLTSEAFADIMAKQGGAHLCFFIGSSHGLSDKIKQKSQLQLSLSDMTFPHALARIVLLEQIYRGFMINSNSRYHK